MTPVVGVGAKLRPVENHWFILIPVYTQLNAFWKKGGLSYALGLDLSLE